jgi:hypothetical protein
MIFSESRNVPSVPNFMTFEIPAGHKFACYAIERVALDAMLREPVSLGDGVTVSFQSPFQLESHWKQWLGTTVAGRLEQSNVFLIATAPSQALAIVDGENQALMTKVSTLFYALFMVEIFYHERAIAFNGANLGDRIEVRSTSLVHDYYWPSRFHSVHLERRHFEQAGRIAEGIRLVHALGSGLQRVKRGFQSWLRAMRESDGAERLHQFVRSLEAVVKPTIGKVKKQFVYRCQLFVGESNDNADMLLDLVEMRGCVEHLNLILESVVKYPEANRETVMQQRICQAQLLASFVYAQIFCDANLRALFSDDAQIEALWQSKREQQRSQWQTKLDWIKIMAARFA